ncbi:hypothetical protein Mal33_12990 [Rosistilla oblonga]|uniref:Uncharacterized protein n=2 Tax=Pirellulaceae TaxID=2691357 RepID=A0A518IQF5_9BACT|nr:hypothetical protein Mal33_12990 [Rosistilla oblonga]
MFPMTSMKSNAPDNSKIVGRASFRQIGCLLALSLVLAGCDAASDAGSAAAPAVDSEFLLAEVPADAVSISDAKQGLEAGGPVTVIARITAGEHDPFEADKAMFLMKSDTTTTLDAEAAAAHEGPGHDPDNCPFCKQKNNPTDSVAIVRFLDEEGKILPQDAREMLGVKKDQVVVVQGTASVDPLGHLMIDASGLFIVR